MQRKAKARRAPPAGSSAEADRKSAGAKAAATSLPRARARRLRLDSAATSLPPRDTAPSLEQIFENVPVGIVHTALDGRYLQVNSALCNLLGYTRQELLALNFQDVTLAEDVPDGESLRRKAMSGVFSVFTREKRYRCKNGEVRWCSATVQLVRDAAGRPQYFVSVIEDISRRRDAESRLQATFNQAAVGIAHTTADGHILEANQKLCEILGYTAQELLQFTTRDLTHPDDRDRQDELRLELLAGIRQSFKGEKRYIRSDGKTIWVNRTVTLAGQPSGEPYLIQVFEDISERKHIEERLRRVTRARRVMVECNHVLAHAADEAGMFKSMCRIVVESGGYKMAWVGLASDDPRRLVYPAAYAGFGDDTPMTGAHGWSADGRYQGFMVDVIKQGKPHIARHILSDPAYARRQARATQHGFQSSIGLPLKSEGTVLGAIAIYAREPDAFDADEIALLTELADDIAFGIVSLRTRTALRESERRFRDVFSQAAVGITRVDLNGVLVEANQKFCDMLGYTRDELIGKAIKDITHPDDYGQGAQYRAQLAQLAARSMAGEKRFIRRDGSIMWARRTMSVARDDAGNPRYIISVVEDITERKQMEEALRLSEEIFRATFDQASVGITMTSLDLRYLRVNDKYCEIVGYSRAELLSGMSVLDVNLAEDVDDVVEHRRKLVAGEVTSVARDKQFRRKDGSLTWVALVTSIVCGGSGEAKHFISVIQDISDRKRVEEALRESEEQFHQLANNIPQVFWICDARQKDMIYVSPAYERVTGQPIESLKTNARSWLKTVHEEDRERVKSAREAAASGQYDEVYRVVRPDGALRWVRDRAFPVHDADGKVCRIAGIAEDITDLRESEERLLYLAHYDNLTSLPNRVLFYDRLKQALSQARRNNWITAVMFLDLDRFKVVNDTLGHGAGDLLLRQVSERLTGCVRSGDTVGRLSGDEFAIVLSNLSGPDDASLVAQKIMATIATPFNLYGKEVFVSASIGITLFPADSLDQDALIRNADTAMYRAKELGRNGFRFYTPEMNARALEKLGLESSLRRALEREEFLLYYQPKVSLLTGEVVGVEALLRWQCPERGLVSPAAFMPMLEETGLVVPVGEWVIRAACAQLRIWREAGLKPVPVAVNLSARQFQAKDLGVVVSRILEEEGIGHDLLELEITESFLAGDTDEAAETLAALSTLGVRVAIDDFGTGYSSLSRLKRFPLDALKIDSSFVRDITTDADDAAITRAIITMAHSLGLAVVAEGVETEQQLAFLNANGCDQIQGYYFSDPLSAADCAALIESGRRLERPARSALAGPPAVPLANIDDDAARRP